MGLGVDRNACERRHERHTGEQPQKVPSRCHASPHARTREPRNHGQVQDASMNARSRTRTSRQPVTLSTSLVA
jgi:hypothetical protein